MKDRPELHLVDERPPSPDELAALEAGARALLGGDLDPDDNEALLALALGGDVLDEQLVDAEGDDAAALATALDGPGQHPLAEFARCLRAAHGSESFRGGALDPSDNEALLAVAVGAELLDGTIIDGEREAGEVLAIGIDQGVGDGPLLRLAASLQASSRPGTIDEITVERLVRHALRRANAEGDASKEAPRRPIWPIASALVALAAGVALWVTAGPASDEAAVSRAPIATDAPVSETRESVATARELAKNDREGLRNERLAPVGASRAPSPTRSRASGARPKGAPAEVPEAAAPPAPDDAFALAEESAPPASAMGGRASPEAEPFATAEPLGDAGGRQSKTVRPPAESEAEGGDADARANASASRFAAPRGGTTDSAFASRSTSTLFDPSSPFSVKGGESERMARIVAVRSAELRANRFASWGIR